MKKRRSRKYITGVVNSLNVLNTLPLSPCLILLYIIRISISVITTTRNVFERFKLLISAHRLCIYKNNSILCKNQIASRDNQSMSKDTIRHKRINIHELIHSYILSIHFINGNNRAMHRKQRFA